eukprot:775368-Rhodomonas_salina.1
MQLGARGSAASHEARGLRAQWLGEEPEEVFAEVGGRQCELVCQRGGVGQKVFVEEEVRGIVAALKHTLQEVFPALFEHKAAVGSLQLKLDWLAAEVLHQPLTPRLEILLTVSPHIAHNHRGRSLSTFQSLDILRCYVLQFFARHEAACPVWRDSVAEQSDSAGPYRRSRSCGQQRW